MSDVVDGTITDIRDVLDRFAALNNYYEHYRWAWSYRLILDYYGLEQITDADVQRVLDDYHEARRMWIGEIKHDAEREFALGDVEPDVYQPVSHLDEHNNRMVAQLVMEEAQRQGAGIIATSVGNHLAMDVDHILKL